MIIARDDYDRKGRLLREERAYSGAGWERDELEDKKRRLREERQAEYSAYLASSTNNQVTRKRGDVSHKPTQIDPRNGLTKAESYKRELDASPTQNIERDRGRERDKDFERERERDYRARDSDEERHKERERDRGDRRERDPDREFNRSRGREREWDKDREGERERSRERERERERDRERDREREREREKERDFAPRKSNDFSSSGGPTDMNKSSDDPQKRYLGAISSLHGGRTDAQVRSEKEKRDVYAKELAQQMEVARQRKEEERLKVQREEEKKWKEIQSYNPWGKPGAGAPPAKTMESFGAIVPREKNTISPNHTLESFGTSPSLSPQNSLPAPSSSMSPPATSLMNTHPEGGRKFMGAISSMTHSEAEMNAQAEKKLQYRRDLEEQMRLKEQAKASDPLAILRTPRTPQQTGSESFPINHTTTVLTEQSTPPPEKTDSSPKFTRARFDQMDSMAQEERVRKNRERQEHLEALQKQQAEKRRLQELEKQREDEKFSRIFRHSEAPPIEETPPAKSSTTAPLAERAQSAKTDARSSEKEAKPEVKQNPILDTEKDSETKPVEKTNKDGEEKEKEKEKEKDKSKARRRGRRHRRHYSSSDESSSASSDSASDSKSEEEEHDGKERRRRRHHHRRSRGKSAEESTLALVRQAIEEEQSKLQRLVLLQQQQQLQFQQQQLQLQQQLIFKPASTIPLPEVTEKPTTTTAVTATTKPPPILNSARKQFLSLIDPDTVQATGKVMIDKTTISHATQTTARPHTTTGAYYNPNSSVKSGTAIIKNPKDVERPGTTSGAVKTTAESAANDTEAPRRPRRDDSTRQSLIGESTFLFPLKSSDANAFALFGDRPDTAKATEDSSPVLVASTSKKSELRTVDPIFKEKPPSEPMFVSVPHLPYDPSFHDEASLKRDKKKKLKEISPSLPSTHRGPKPDSSAVVSSKSTMDIDTLYKINEKRLKNLQRHPTIEEEIEPEEEDIANSPPIIAEPSQPTARTRTKPAKFMWDLVSPDGRDIKTPQVFSMPSSNKIWDM